MGWLKFEFDFWFKKKEVVETMCKDCIFASSCKHPEMLCHSCLENTNNSCWHDNEWWCSVMNEWVFGSSLAKHCGHCVDRRKVKIK